MMDPEKTVAEESGSTQSPAVPEELLPVVKFWKEQGVAFLLTIAVVAALAAFGGFLLNRHRQKEAEAWSRLMLVNSSTGMEEFLKEFGGTSSAPLALLLAAKADFDAGQFDVAATRYIEFQSKYPKHQMVLVAEVGGIHCMEAKGETSRALDAFNAFAENHPHHFLYPVVVIGKARCLEALGKADSARVVYEDFVTAHPENPWRDVVSGSLERLEKNRRSGSAAGSETLTPAQAIPQAGPTNLTMEFGPVEILE